MIRYAQVFSFCWLVLPFRERNKLKTYNCIVFTYFNHTKLSPFQIATSVWFFLKRFSKFRKFQPRYSYKIYSDIKRVYSDNARSTVFYQLKI